jgi:hypothetical protein
MQSGADVRAGFATDVVASRQVAIPTYRKSHAKAPRSCLHNAGPPVGAEIYAAHAVIATPLATYCVQVYFLVDISP